MKFDFYKIITALLLVFLTYGIFHLAKTIEIHGETKKVGRFVLVEHIVLDTQTGATYYEGEILSNPIIK